MAEQNTWGMLRIKLVSSPIGYSIRQKRTVKALGLRRMQQVVVRPANPAVRGMLAKIPHLVQVKELTNSENSQA